METKKFFDENFDESEQLLRKFTVNFDSCRCDNKLKTRVTVNGVQVGDVIDDNAKDVDNYRFHDVFHYTFATLLGWSPCTRAMMNRKRKSNPIIDEFEDGARATITEEAISLIIFNNAKKSNFFKDRTRVNLSLLAQIKQLTSSFEVNIRTKKDWENAILTGYSLFHNLIQNDGGKVNFNMLERSAYYEMKTDS